eukprot:TRINITY_DN207_c0_g1_i1.p1 TRINITY_DN207_c0_g1~~TRINITY_DN207_c0_g1_i1.p1  ORF type:complete len:211 (+),score=43.89 TRINITY_DN207_c0_g1_i1:101-733(+)
MVAKIAVIYYSTYGHNVKMSEAIAEAMRKNSDVTVDIFQVPETLSEEILGKMHAAPKADYPKIDAKKLTEYDGFIFSIPTRYGVWPAQWKAFLDSTGQVWASGGYQGKMAGVMTSTSSQHGGIETTAMTAVTFMAHHGIIYVPLGYSLCFPELTQMDEVCGATPYGGGTHTGGNGARQPSELELKVIGVQGEYFARTVAAYVRGKDGQTK